MNLNSKQWHVRWFNFVQGVIGSRYKYRYGTTLCHFIRVCFLWGFLLVVAMMVALTILVVIFIVAPFYGIWAGPLALAFLAAGVGASYLVYMLLAKYGNKLAPVGGMAHCVYEHAKAVKGRFCPIIKFDGASYD